jgi:Ala-tRNA(Pro) deacylase
LLVETLGVPPGSVTPFSLINDTDHKVRVVLDAEMLKQEPLNYHPLRNDRTISVSKDDLLKFIASCGHTPMIETLPEAAP